MHRVGRGGRERGASERAAIGSVSLDVSVSRAGCSCCSVVGRRGGVCCYNVFLRAVPCFDYSFFHYRCIQLYCISCTLYVYSMYVYMYMCVCVYVCVCVCIHTHTCVCVYTHTRDVCVHVCVYTTDHSSLPSRLLLLKDFLRIKTRA